MSYQQPPQGPAPYTPGQPGPAEQSPQHKPRLRGTRRLMWGLILMGVGIVGGIIGAVVFGFAAANQFETFDEESYDIQEHVSVDGLGDNQWYIYQPDLAAGSITCEVTDESGQNIVDEAFSSSVETNQYSYEAMQSFTSEADGVYEISCTDYPVLLAGGAPIGGIFGAIGSAALGFVVFVVGLVLTIIGAVVRSKAKRQTPPSGPMYGGGTYPGYPQQYGQQPPQA